MSSPIRLSGLPPSASLVPTTPTLSKSYRLHMPRMAAMSRQTTASSPQRASPFYSNQAITVPRYRSASTPRWRGLGRSPPTLLSPPGRGFTARKATMSLPEGRSTPSGGRPRTFDTLEPPCGWATRGCSGPSRRPPRCDGSSSTTHSHCTSTNRRTDSPATLRGGLWPILLWAGRFWLAHSSNGWRGTPLSGSGLAGCGTWSLWDALAACCRRDAPPLGLLRRTPVQSQTSTPLLLSPRNRSSRSLPMASTH
mmetsp:Transcript_18264/g.47714  ORF Transcript_18264/g.47714 Transcript_18264/m.47714 type:complete len:252 (-) Transcript_18264:1387-2142(-)